MVERAFEHAACGLIVARHDGTMLRFNAAARALMAGGSPTEAGRCRLDLCFPVPDGAPGLATTLSRAAARGISSLELPTADPAGSPRVLNWLINGTDGVLVLAVADVTSRRALGDQLAHLAYHDPLTGLPNRTLILQRLEHALRRRERAGAEVALLFLDLDRFKEINDLYGHEAGDQLLVALANRLEAVVRPADTVGRLSGDEFVVVCEDVDDVEAAMQVIDRMEAALGEPFLVNGVPTRLTASIGCSMTDAEVADTDGAELLRNADRSMYEVKRRRDGASARSRLVPAAGADPSGALDAADLRRSLAAGEIAVVYQPQVSLSDGRIVSVESLVRWHHPDHGLLLPEVFLPMAEASGVVHELGRHVLDVACRQAAAWAADATRADRHPPVVTVNVSRTDLADGHLPGRVSLALEAAGLDPPSSGSRSPRTSCRTGRSRSAGRSPGSASWA
jgi:diguanylate cyclase (GGDEF)-like protein